MTYRLDFADPAGRRAFDASAWARLSSRALAVFPDAVPVSDQVAGVLTDAGTGLLLEVADGRATLTLADPPDGVDTVTLMERVQTLALAVEDETGFVGTDPQLGEPVRPAVGPGGGPLPEVPTGGWDDEQAGPAGRVDGRVREHRRWWEFWRFWR